MSIKGYLFYIRPVTDPESEWVAANGVPQENPDYQFTGLASDTDYEIAGRAVDLAGNESELSEPLAVTTPVHNPADEPMSASDEAALDAIVASVRAGGLGYALNAGCQVYITGPKGYYRKAFGTAYGRSLTLDDKQRYGSITKCATATLILAQVDAGHLSLDDVIGDYVTGITNGDVITMRMLLMMRSGIKDYLQQDSTIQQSYALNPTAAFDPLPTIRSYTTPLHAPDAVTDYSNSNYILLGMVLESLDATYGSARPVRQILLEDFCAAVGMNESEWPTGNYMTAPYSRGWWDNPAYATIVATITSLPLYWLLGSIYWSMASSLTGGWPTTPNYEFTAVSTGWAGAAGALDGTIADLVRYGEALRDGELLSPAMKQLREELFRTYIAYAPVHPWDGDGWSGAGLGLMQFGQWHGWIGNIGGYMALMFYNNVNGAVAAIMGNYFMFPVTEMFYQIRYHLWPDSVDSVPWMLRMSTGIDSAADEFGTGALWPWQAIGDADGTTQVPHKVPFTV